MTTPAEREAHFGGGLRQLAIVAVLVGALILLHRFAVPSEADFDPTVMLAFGFVVLASYTIGQLAEVLRLPHITGYLIAGVLLGASIVPFLPEAWRLPPFDDGVLNPEVIRSFGLVDALAVALIALTAGGELKIDALRRGMRTIGGLLVFQVLAIGVVIVAFVWAVAGGIPGLALPGVGTLGPMAALVLGATVATISLSTSPAATIAVINDARAEGPMTRNVLSTVVLKDVVVVLLFAITSTLAVVYLGDGEPLPLGDVIFKHIVGSIGAGALLGGLMGLYLRFVGQELLLFLLGVVYLATFVASGLELDPVLLFLTAGFTVSNFSRAGNTLIHSVERLSLPVYVVFFTLAGARLHLDSLVALAPFAFAIVGLRAVAIYVGAFAGARLGKADPATRKFAWLGFLSQAGVGIALTTQIGNNLGAPGKALATLLFAGIALNELIGPVLLKVGLSLAKELPGQKEGPSEQAPEPAEPLSRATERALSDWPEAPKTKTIWGGPPKTRSRELNDRLLDLNADLRALVREVSGGPLEDFRQGAEVFLRELRREYLRHHRRLVVQTRSDADPAALAAQLRTQQSELAERWRGIVLGRAVRLRQPGWTPDALVERIDRIVEGLPERLEVPLEPESLRGPAKGAPPRRVRRAWLRVRVAVRRVVGLPPPTRTLELRALARYHLSGRVPGRLEALAALLVHSDRHLAARARSLFDAIVQGYDDLAHRVTAEPDLDPGARLVALRQEVEDELALALDEVGRMTRDGSQRAAAVLGEGYRAVKNEAPRFGTFDLPAHQRRSSHIFRQRARAIETLTERLRRVRRTSAAGYSLLALELELVGLEARIKDALEEHVSELEKDVRGRGHVQTERMHGALQEAIRRVEEVLDGEHTGERMAMELRQIAESTEKVAGEAARAAQQLRDQLSDERTGGRLLDALARASRGLTDRYEVTGERIQHGEWRLPQVVTPVQVPFRELVQTWIDTHIAPQLMAATRDVARRVQPLAASLAELERLVAFNVELASGELEVVHDERVPAETRSLLHEMVSGSLERNLGMVRGYVDASARWPDDLGREVRQAVIGGLEALRAELVDGNLSRTRIEQLRRSGAGRRLIQEAGQLRGFVGGMRRELTRAVRDLAGETRMEGWRRGLGLPAPRRLHVVGQQDAFAPPQVSGDIPLVYRRLFAADTLEAGDVLTRREPEIARARQVLEGRNSGRLRSTVLVGLDGVGKGAVSSAIVRSRAWKQVRRIHPTRPLSVAEVKELFRDRTEGHLIVVSGLHWMVSMQPGGFEPLRRFVRGVIQDGGRNAWLVHADLLFWQYASHVAPMGEAFPEVVHLDPLDPDALQSAVLARHALSGYGLSFEPDSSGSRLERAVARGMTRLRRPYDRYFRKLHGATKGLVRDALRLWLASIERVDETHGFVHVGALPPSPASTLMRLPDEVLLQLYQISRQGWMDARSQAHVFRVDHDTAQAQLAHLLHLGLLEVHGEGVYRIAVHLRGAVVRVLQERGWVR
ncbi:MAG: cation:proton antiporter [Myxococcota bacterium]